MKRKRTGGTMSGLDGLGGRMMQAALGAVALAVLLVAGQAGAGAANGPAGKLVYTGPDGIYVQRTGATPQRIWKAASSGQGSDPRWSPDGSRLVFSGPDGNIWIMNGDGSSAHALNAQAIPASDCGEDGCTNPGSEADSAAWSPDGADVSYRLVEDLSRASIWVVAANGGAPRQIASASDLCLFDEGFAPDGRPLYSRCATDTSPSNATYSGAANGQKALVAGSQLAFAADGSRIAFSNHALTGGTASVNLFVSSQDGSGAQVVASGGQNPSWSRSGLLAYQIGSQDGWVMHVYDPATGKDTAAGYGLLGGWTPDGGYLYYTQNAASGSTIWIVHADGTGATQVATGSFPDWAQ